MSDHLPECDWAKNDGECRSYSGWDEQVWEWHRDQGGTGRCSRCEVVCQCDLLRACEARVREEYAMEWQSEQEEVHILGLNLAYGKGLDAARDAVASVAISNSWPEEPTVAALAAIDALRGES